MKSVLADTNLAFGRTYVNYGKALSGKTVSALRTVQQLVQQHTFGIPCIYVEAGTNLKESLKEVLGVPDTIRVDPTWLRYLTLYLGKNRPPLEESTTLLQKLKEKVPACVAPAETNTPYKNETETMMPVIVIDDLLSFDDETEGLIRRLYDEANTERVMLFILTPNQEIANLVCGMNGKERVRPLPNRFNLDQQRSPDDSEQLESWRIEERIGDRAIARGINWAQEEWPRARLTRIVLRHYQDKNDPFDWTSYLIQIPTGSYIHFLVDGLSPQRALKQADCVAQADTENSNETLVCSSVAPLATVNDKVFGFDLLRRCL